MTEYLVYYRRSPTFRADKKLKYKDVIRPEDTRAGFYRAGYVNSPHKDEKDSVFYHMQGDFMCDRTRALCKNLIVAGEMGHTSMSVGDVLRDADTGKMWQCDDVGWVPVRKITETRITRVAPIRDKFNRTPTCLLFLQPLLGQRIPKKKSTTKTATAMSAGRNVPNTRMREGENHMIDGGRY